MSSGTLKENLLGDPPSLSLLVIRLYTLADCDCCAIYSKGRGSFNSQGFFFSLGQLALMNMAEMSLTGMAYSKRAKTNARKGGETLITLICTYFLN